MVFTFNFSCILFIIFLEFIWAINSTIRVFHYVQTESAGKTILLSFKILLFFIAQKWYIALSIPAYFIFYVVLECTLFQFQYVNDIATGLILASIIMNAFDFILVKYNTPFQSRIARLLSIIYCSLTNYLLVKEKLIRPSSKDRRLRAGFRCQVRRVFSEMMDKNAKHYSF